MSNDPSIIKVPGFFRGKIVKILTFTPEGLSIEKPLSFDPVNYIPVESIIAFRYGIRFISGFQFVIGRRYIIEILDTDNHITRINLKSVYKIRRKVYGDIWSDIVNQLWRYYFHKKLIECFNYYKQGEPFELAGVEFSSLGFQFDNKRWFWDEFALSNYQTYFVVHHKTNLKKMKGFNFLIDWNALVLQSLLKTIVEDQQEKATDII